MGKNVSKRKALKITTKIPNIVICPICNKNFNTTITYNQLNQHLNECGKNLRHSNLSSSTPKANEYKPKLQSNNNINSNDNDINDINSKLKKFSSFISEKINSSNKEKITITSNTIDELFLQLKSVDIYSTISIDFASRSQCDLGFFIEKYCEYMIDNNMFCIINGKTISFSFNDDNFDWELFGVVISIILIYSDIKIKYKFNSLLCKMLLEQQLILNDIQYSHRSLYESLLKISKEEDLEELNINFTVEGNELIPNGKSMKVDENNIKDYLDRRICYEAEKYKDKITLIRNKIFEYIPQNELMVFTGDEFYQVINRML